MSAVTFIFSPAGSRKAFNEDIRLIGGYPLYCSICNTMESEKIDRVVAVMGCNQARIIATQIMAKISWRDAALKHFTVFIKGTL